MPYTYSPFTGTLDYYGSPTGSSGIVTNKVEYFTTTSGDISNKYITLNNTPISATEVTLDVINGCTQYYGEDYIVTGSNVEWGGFGLENIIEIGDKLRVIYSY